MKWNYAANAANLQGSLYARHAKNLTRYSFERTLKGFSGLIPLKAKGPVVYRHDATFTWWKQAVQFRPGPNSRIIGWR